MSGKLNLDPAVVAQARELARLAEQGGFGVGGDYADDLACPGFAGCGRRQGAALAGGADDQNDGALLHHAAGQRGGTADI